ncbi:unnamed protein product [Didymodactylos carnosus]|uniref:Uncharacterized protein n=1 Tax=Didymodactylos carnosus TaxID=1234261 RepID=A0A8S2EAY6_9BILA|nr:unnamed protein product [Didymodactylos carnosus]CAF3988948.1 unnamed protein product [Didymodactylos carnosus]
MSENKTKFLPRRNPHIYYVPRKPDVQKGVVFTPKTNHIQPLHKQIYFRPPLLPALPTSRKREQLKSNSRPVQLLPIHRQKEKSTSVPRLKYISVDHQPVSSYNNYPLLTQWQRSLNYNLPLCKNNQNRKNREQVYSHRKSAFVHRSDNGYSSSNRYENSLRMHQRKQQRYDEQAKLFGETLTLQDNQLQQQQQQIENYVRNTNPLPVLVPVLPTPPQPIIYPQNMYNSLNMSNACAWRPAMTRMGPAGG